MSVATILRDGPRDGAKAMMKAGLRGRDSAAELFERVQDLYAEARLSTPPTTVTTPDGSQRRTGTPIAATGARRILLPVRQAELFRWCLNAGLRAVKPMTYMSRLRELPPEDRETRTPPPGALALRSPRTRLARDRVPR